MSTSLIFALEELPLVFFTALAPTGSICLVLLACISFASNTNEQTLHAITKKAWIPGVIVTIGFISSAAHLGTPANSLYILAGVGRSPLSNEVFSLCVFMPFAGALWLYSCFTDERNINLVRKLSSLVIVTGILFIIMVAVAYKTETIITWDTPYVIANQILGSIIGGTFLFRLLIVLTHTTTTQSKKHIKRAITVILVVSIMHIVTMVLQWTDLQSIQGASSYAYELIPFYPAIIIFYAACFIGALILCTKSKVSHVIAGNILFIIGILIIRFAFYMMHMTIGLSM